MIDFAELKQQAPEQCRRSEARRRRSLEADLDRAALAGGMRNWNSKPPNSAEDQKPGDEEAWKLIWIGLRW